MAKEAKEPDFSKLPAEFRDSMQGKSETEVRQAIAQVAINDAIRHVEQADDQDLQQKKELAKEANEQYALDFKENKLKIKFLRSLLQNGGEKA